MPGIVSRKVSRAWMAVRSRQIADLAISSASECALLSLLRNFSLHFTAWKMGKIRSPYCPTMRVEFVVWKLTDLGLETNRLFSTRSDIR